MEKELDFMAMKDTHTVKNAEVKKWYVALVEREMIDPNHALLVRGVKVALGARVWGSLMMSLWAKFNAIIAKELENATACVRAIIRIKQSIIY